MNIFRHECFSIRNKMLSLGDYIVGNYDDDKVEKVFLDTDFKDRAILKIVTDNNFAPLFNSYKVNILL